jgi:excisionase family DNA binding protein
MRDDVAAAVAALLDVPATVTELRAELRELRAEVATLRRALPPTLASIPEAAAHLGVSIATMRRRVRAGDVPSLRVGRSVRVDVGALQAVDVHDVEALARAARSAPVRGRRASKHDG